MPAERGVDARFALPADGGVDFLRVEPAAFFEGRRPALHLFRDHDPADLSISDTISTRVETTITRFDPGEE